MSHDFYMAKYEITILSEGEPPDEALSLAEIDAAITQGPYVGAVSHMRTIPVSAARMRDLLEQMDCDLSVFDLVEDEDTDGFEPETEEEEEELLREDLDDGQDDD